MPHETKISDKDHDMMQDILRRGDSVPSGWAVNFDNDPPYYKLPSDELDQREKAAELERKSAEKFAASLDQPATEGVELPDAKAAAGQDSGDMNADGSLQAGEAGTAGTGRGSRGGKAIP